MMIRSASSKPGLLEKRPVGRPRKDGQPPKSRGGSITKSPGDKPRPSTSAPPGPTAPGSSPLSDQGKQPAGGDLAGSIRAMLDQSKTPGAQPAPKPGPKPGPKAAAKFEAPPQELIGRLWSGCFEIVAARGGAHWKLTGEESGWLGQASHDALNRYGPGLSKHIEAVVLAIAILAVFAPRVAYQISAAKKAAKSKPTKAD